MERIEKGLKKVSIQKKQILILIGLVIFQGLLYLMILKASGIFSYLAQSESERMVTTTRSRKDVIERMMTSQWSNIESFAGQINAQVKEILDSRGQDLNDLRSDRELNLVLTGTLSGTMIDLLRQSGANDAYFILEEDGIPAHDFYVTGLRVRSSDPKVNYDTKDLLLENGVLSKEMYIPPDSFWESRFRIEDIPEFYTIVLDTAKNFPDSDINDLGYWSDVFQWHPEDMEMISFSMPLINEEGAIYGIFGIAVSTDYVTSFMPDRELDSEGGAAYVIARADGTGQNYRPLISSGNYSSDMENLNGEISMEEDILFSKVKKIQDTNLCTVTHFLNVYKYSSRYFSDRWYIIGVVPENILFSTLRQLRFLIGVALISSILIAGIAAIVMGNHMTYPLRKLVLDIRQQEGNENFKNTPSGILEIDELRDAICSMDASIRENTSRLSRIIQLMQLSMGAVEYTANENRIYCVGKIVPLLQMDESEYDEGRMSREYFENFLIKAGLGQVLEKNCEIEYEMDAGEEKRWIHVESWHSEGKIFIIVLDQTEIVLEKQKIEHERDYDSLTNLLNRRAFDRKVEEYFKYHPYMTCGAMIMWDLDNLKYMNDSYGHDYGDAYIRKAAVIFQSLSERYPQALVSRISGDEFLAFIPECSAEEEILDVMDNIRRKLRDTKISTPDGDTIAMKASGGVAFYPRDGKNPEELKKCADFAMYDTKTSNKGFFKIFNRDRYNQDSMLLTGVEALDKLIAERQVTYYFQPIVSAKDGEVFAYEALMRPTSKTITTVSDVIRIASDQARLAEIEVLTFEMAFAHCHRQRSAFENAKLFVNSIPNQVLSNEIIEQLLSKYPDCQERLVVEMIENEPIHRDILIEKQYICRQNHVEIALDDFGSGYSTEEILLAMQPNYVKVDQALIRGIYMDEDKKRLLKNLLSYTKAKGIRVIAEGIENAEDMRTVIDLGVDYMQGNYLGKPSAKAQEISEKIQRQIEGC